MTFEDLPKVDKSHIQSAESERALEGVFCLPDFICRKQTPDYGKDYEIELVVNGSPANIPFSVQLKSAAAVSLDSAEGYIRFSIETKCLHYLNMNLCGSLIVLYDASSKSLFYQWVQEIICSLDSISASWRNQESVTIRLPVANTLKNNAASIHADVYQRFSRLQIAIQQSGIPPIPGLLNADASNVDGDRPDPHRILDSLMEDGFALVSGGHHDAVIKAYASIPSSTWRTIPRHLLIIAYAYDTCGLPLQALTYSNSYLAMNGESAKPRNEIALGRYIKLHSQLNTGQIDSEAYYKALRGLAKEFEDCAEIVQVVLQIILIDIVKPDGTENPVEQSNRLLVQAREIVDKATKGVERVSFTWGLEILLARIEFQFSIHHIMTMSFQLLAAERVGYSVPLSKRWKMAEPALNANSKALERLDALYKLAETSHRRDIAGYCDYEIAFNQLSFVTTMRALPTASADQESRLITTLEECLKRAEGAAIIFRANGSKGLHFKALRLRAEILEAFGRDAEAAKERESLKKEGEILGLPPRMVKWSAASKYDAKKRPSREEVGDTLIHASDDELRQRAFGMLHLFDLPDDRIENAFKDLSSMRLMRLEQIRWCKHLGVLQNLRHTGSQKTLYSTDPDRIWKCEKFGHVSRIAAPDPIPLLVAFKSAYCDKCQSREISISEPKP